MKLNNVQFKKYITAARIRAKVKKLATQLNKDYQRKTPLFLPVLNGSFMFTADLLKQISVPCRVSFVKHASYQGSTAGTLKTLIGLSESVFEQHVVVVEDIMETGQTLSRVVAELKGLGAKSVEVVVLLRKVKAKPLPLKPRYVGFDIADPFVVGYGLDLDGLGRNFPDIYQKVR